MGRWRSCGGSKEWLIPTVLTILAGGLAIVGAQALPADGARHAVAIPVSDGPARQWEYCSLALSTTSPRPKKGEPYSAYANICYFQETGCRHETIEARGTIDNAGIVYLDARAKAIAKLGNEKWELFLLEQLPDAVYYFRRPKS
jgi:hypothetical protein